MSSSLSLPEGMTSIFLEINKHVLCVLIKKYYCFCSIRSYYLHIFHNDSLEEHFTVFCNMIAFPKNMQQMHSEEIAKLELCRENEVDIAQRSLLTLCIITRVQILILLSCLSMHLHYYMLSSSFIVRYLEDHRSLF